jgi:uncharacterized protein
MAPNPIHIRALTLAAAAVWVLTVELAAGWWLQRTACPPLLLMGLARLLQAGGMLGVVVQLEGGLHAVGWAPRTWRAGLIKGACWASGFALVAGLAVGLAYLAGYDPLAMIRQPLPGEPSHLLLFFLVGGFIGPVAEEICFRGILYSFFRRWGVVPALVCSTAIFVAPHAFHGIHFTQIVGGIVFALAFETSRNLMVPITIHVLGNLAIFTLSLTLTPL